MKSSEMIVLMLFFLGIIKAVFFSKIGFGLLDEGENLHNGLRILQGQLPYRDFYTLLPPLDNTWPVIAYKIFGISIFSPRLLSSIIFAVLPPVFFLIMKKNVSTIFALIPGILIIFMDLNIERIYYYSFIFGGLLLFLNTLESKNQKLKIVAGALLGIGSLIRLDIAGGFLLGILLSTLMVSIINKKTLLKELLSQCGSLCLGFLGVCLLLLIWLVINNLLVDFLRAFFFNSLQVTNAYSISFPNITEIFPMSVAPYHLLIAYSAGFAYLIMITYLMFSIYIIKNWVNIWRYQTSLGYLFLIGIIISPYMVGRMDLGHMVKGGMPFLFLGTYLLFLLAKKITRALKMPSYIILLIPIFILISNLVQSWWWVRFNDTKTVFTMGTVYLNSSYPADTTLISADTIQRAVKFIESNAQPDGPFLAAPYMAGLYFLANRPSKTYVDNIFVGFLPDEQKFIEDIENLKIDIVIYDPIHGPKSKQPKLRDYYPKLDSYIMKNFDIVEQTHEGWLFMKRINVK